MRADVAPGRIFPDFLAQWKNADPGIPLLKQPKQNCVKLNNRKRPRLRRGDADLNSGFVIMRRLYSPIFWLFAVNALVIDLAVPMGQGRSSLRAAASHEIASDIAT